MADPGTGTAPPSAAVVDEAVKPYKIHIPNKYLEQVKRKLELTRLPHEGSEPKSDDWWEPKPLVEPLIDFWLDKYNWRDQENILNDTLPQYRTAITLPLLASPLRIHFIHVRSPHENAIPLLLIPPFPFTNLSFGHLIKPLTDPSGPNTLNQPFHLVIPSLPGLGFSDALPNNLAPIPATAGILDSLMARLSYRQYLVSGASPGHLSPAEIDFKLINHLSTRYTSSCIGAHFISPPLEAPRFRENAWEYLKWTVANFFHAEILGYTVEDFQALDRIHRRPGASSATTLPRNLHGSEFGFDGEPNTLAYALCDSPTGMLAFVLKALRGLRPGEDSAFSQEQLVTLTNLAWLPGPEHAMRFWAHCKRHDEVVDIGDEKGKKGTAAGKKPYVGITVFLGDDGTRTKTTKTGPGDGDIADTEPGKGKVEEKPQPSLGGSGILLAPLSEQPGGIRLTGPETAIESATATGAEKGGKSRKLTAERYICPAWANGRYNVVHTQRASGKAGGLLAFERPDAVIDGIRGLAKGLLALPDNPFKTTPTLTDKGPALPPPTTTEPEARGGESIRTVPLEAILVVPAGSAPTTGLTAPALPTTITRTTIPTIPGFGKKLPTLDEEKTSPKVDKGKGKEKEIDVSPSPVRPAASPRTTGTSNPATAAAARTDDGLLSPPQLPRDHSFGDGSSPDTLVEGQVGKKKGHNNSPSPLLGDNITLVSPSSQEPSPARSPAGLPSTGASPGPAPAPATAPEGGSN